MLAAVLSLAVAVAAYTGVLALVAATCRRQATGTAVFVGAHVVVGAATLVFDLSLAPVAEHLGALAFAAALASGVLAHAAGREEPPGTWERWPGRLLWGTRAKATVMGLDLKKLAYRCGLLWLGIVAASLAYLQFRRHGEVSPAMGLHVVLWWSVVFTHFLHESAIETTSWYRNDGLGVIGLGTFLVIVPFVLPVGGYELLDPSASRSPAVLAAASALVALGLWVERSATLQKHRFLTGRRPSRAGPAPEALEGQLLISGWWGLGRHLNYTAELAMLWGFAVLTAGRSAWPYAIPLAATLALGWRAGREARRCAAQYGALWDAYRARAWLRLLPYL